MVAPSPPFIHDWEKRISSRTTHFGGVNNRHSSDHVEGLQAVHSATGDCETLCDHNQSGVKSLRPQNRAKLDSSMS